MRSSPASLLLAVAAAMPAGVVLAAPDEAPDERPAAAGPDSAYAFEVTRIDGERIDLARYRGKVLLVVNTASRCGFTPQYEGLQALHERYGKEGLVVLAFPCNQFGGQEPGTAAEIRAFCSDRYSVSFPLFAKVDVKGERAAPLYRWLTAARGGAVRWNFTKFLIGRDGQVLERFEPKVRPDAEPLIQAVEQAVAAPAPQPPAAPAEESEPQAEEEAEPAPPEAE